EHGQRCGGPIDARVTPVVDDNGEPAIAQRRRERHRVGIGRRQLRAGDESHIGRVGRVRHRVILAGLVAIVGTACGSNGAEHGRAPAPPPRPTPPRPPPPPPRPAPPRGAPPPAAPPRPTSPPPPPPRAPSAPPPSRSAPPTAAPAAGPVRPFASYAGTYA